MIKTFTKKTITGKKKGVGCVIDHRFVKHIQLSKHLFRKANALGIDSDLISKMKINGVKVIVLMDDESGDRYICSFDRFMRHCWVHRFVGFQSQSFMEVPRWHIYSSDGLKIQDGRKDENDLQVDKQKKLEQMELIPLDVKMRMATMFKNISSKKQI